VEAVERPASDLAAEDEVYGLIGLAPIALAQITSLGGAEQQRRSGFVEHLGDASAARGKGDLLAAADA
jgi:hypothetical protein